MQLRIQVQFKSNEKIEEYICQSDSMTMDRIGQILYRKYEKEIEYITITPEFHLTENSFN